MRHAALTRGEKRMVLRTCKTGPRIADDPDAEEGCAFPLDDPDSGKPAARFCGAPRRPGSSYCPSHHTRCHLATGSAAELQRLRMIDALADRQAAGSAESPASRRRKCCTGSSASRAFLCARAVHVLFQG